MRHSLPAALMLAALLLSAGCGRREEPPVVPPSPASKQAPAREPASAATAENAGEGAAKAGAGNAPPRILAVPFREPRIHRGVDIEVLPEAEDPDYDLVSFRYQWFVNGEPQADLEGPVLPGDRFRKGDRIAVRVTPHDGKENGETFSAQPFVVPNAPPRFVTEPPLQFRARVYGYAARAEDPDGDPVAYTLEEGPQGMAIDGHSGALSWQIGAEQAGSYTVRIVAADEEGAKAIQEYSLTVALGEETK